MVYLRMFWNRLDFENSVMMYQRELVKSELGWGWFVVDTFREPVRPCLSSEYLVTHTPLEERGGSKQPYLYHVTPTPHPSPLTGSQVNRTSNSP